MDKTTTWLVRIASAVFIAAGTTAIILMLSSTDLINNGKGDNTLVTQAKKKKLLMGNLGEADGSTNTFSSTITSNPSAETFDIWCKEKKNDCQVNIDSERLRVNGGIGIVNEQIVWYQKTRELVGLFKFTHSTFSVAYVKNDGTKSIAKFILVDKGAKDLKANAFADALTTLTFGEKSRNSINRGGGGGSSSKNQFDYKEFKQNEKIRDLENRIEMDKINRQRGYGY